MQQCKSVGSREGLYVMVFILLLNSCDTNHKVNALAQQLLPPQEQTNAGKK